MLDRQQPRETCFTCDKPRSTCVCASIVRVDNRTGVFVLQHPRERAHPIGTARFVELGLARSEVVVAYGDRRNLVHPLALPPRTGLLYPKEGARDLEELDADERPAHLLVLDGTWSQARTLYNRNTWLASLPHYRLSPTSPSRYRIRREPSPDYVSTLESVLLALHVLEPETEGLSGLLAAFDAMVDTQIRRTEAASRAGIGRRHQVRTKRDFHGVPVWLGERFDRLVGVYAEALPVHNRDDGDDRADSADGDGGVDRANGAAEHAAARRPRELLQLAAVRLSTGERYERMVAPPSGVPDDAALSEVGLCAADFAHAIAPDALAAEFAAFVRPGEVCLAWNGIAPSLMHEATGVAYRVRLLKPVVRGLQATLARRNRTPDDSLETLDQLAEHTSPEPVTPLDFRGRAAIRLANLRRTAAWARSIARRRDCR